MREIQYEKQLDPEKRVKVFTIDSKSQDKKSVTRIKKSFKYAVDWAKESEPVTKPPLVSITKSFDTKKGIEAFCFHV